jgi:REP-associated tyrosine transposase
MTARRPARLKTFDYQGKHRYFVTCSTEGRQKLFVDSDVVADLSDQVFRTCNERDFTVLALAFMEDHLHLLVEGKSHEAHFVSMMTLLRQRTAIAFRRVAGRRLWQDGYYERVLRPTDNVFQIIEYIRSNPAEAGSPAERSRHPYVWWATDVGQRRP